MKFRVPPHMVGDLGRSPCGERGLKLALSKMSRTPLCRSPCGERGLKCVPARYATVPALVAPRAGRVG